MADYIITPLDVIVVPNPRNNTSSFTVENNVIFAGELVHINTDGKAVPADGTAVELSSVFGIALNDAEHGQPIHILRSGILELGSVGTTGDIAVLSGTNPAKMAPSADLITSNIVTVVGVFTSPSQISVSFINSLVTKA